MYILSYDNKLGGEVSIYPTSKDEEIEIPDIK